MGLIVREFFDLSKRKILGILFIVLVDVLVEIKLRCLLFVNENYICMIFEVKKKFLGCKIYLVDL